VSRSLAFSFHLLGDSAALVANEERHGDGKNECRYREGASLREGP